MSKILAYLISSFKSYLTTNIATAAAAAAAAAAATTNRLLNINIRV
jgi:hypothetical protein